MVGRAPPLLDLAAGQLREAVPAPPDSNGHDRAPVDVERVHAVRSEIPHPAERVPDLGLAAGAQVHTANGSVVRHAEENDPAVGVGERHRRLRDARMRYALLELDVETLTRELRCELLRGERSGGSALTGGMEQRI